MSFLRSSSCWALNKNDANKSNGTETNTSYFEMFCFKDNGRIISSVLYVNNTYFNIFFMTVLKCFEMFCV